MYIERQYVETTKSKTTSQEQENLDDMSNLVVLNDTTILDSKYEIKREIARGGMGIVYEAYHKYTHKKVAIKVILAYKVTPIQLKRFQKEIEAYSLLSHPNVITIYDAGIYNNYPYIVMEYIEGVDICTYVKQQEEKNTPEDSKNGEPKERDWKLCARLIYETALGLEYIHSQKMIHRDIKPANIIVRSNGSPVIIDLGLIKFNKTDSYNLTRSREIIGTIEYMPIEQAQGKKGKIDARTDVYSLGLVLYELLTGQVAYNGENIMELVYKIMFYYPPTPRKINPKIPEVLETITRYAIEKQKEKRYASMKEFANALKEYLNDITVTSISQYSQIKQKLLFKKSIHQEFAEVQNTLGVMYANGDVVKQNLQKARELYEESASQGYAEAQYNLGNMYYFGQGVKQDLQKAVYWYTKSANQGYAEAQYILGNMYYFGQGVKQDLQKAVYWYTKSANQGYAVAQSNLGIMYDLGDGVEQDYTQAVYWYTKSAHQGYAVAQSNLGAMYANGDGVKRDLQKAVYWYAKSANQGYAVAQFNLGFMYYQGKGVRQDYTKAFELYEQSAEQGNVEAQSNLGFMYYQGKGIKRNLQKAVYWYEKSANQGYAVAQSNLGFIYYKGNGVQQDFQKAIYWYEKSANQGYAVAQVKLGIMYYLGKHIKQNIEKAIYWLEKAKQNNSTNAAEVLDYIKKQHPIQSILY